MDLVEEFLFEELTEENFVIYAAKNYYNPKTIDADDFFEDLQRFKYIKRLINRYKKNNELMERLILNHLIVVFNSFGYNAGIRMLAHRLDWEYWDVLKPFLLFLKAIREEELAEISMDEKVIQRLRSI